MQRRKVEEELGGHFVGLLRDDVGDVPRSFDEAEVEQVRLSERRLDVRLDAGEYP